MMSFSFEDTGLFQFDLPSCQLWPQLSWRSQSLSVKLRKLVEMSIHTQINECLKWLYVHEINLIISSKYLATWLFVTLYLFILLPILQSIFFYILNRFLFLFLIFIIFDFRFLMLLLLLLMFRFYWLLLLLKRDRGVLGTIIT